jgi:hypothetical protein
MEKMKLMIGKVLCRIGLHKWGKPFVAVKKAPWGGSLWGTLARDCQRPGCKYRLWHWPS